MIVERVTGVEPAALGLGSRCSTTELYPQKSMQILQFVGWNAIFRPIFLSEFPDSCPNSQTLCHEVHIKGIFSASWLESSVFRENTATKYTRGGI